MRSSSLQGRVSPINGAESIWAVMGDDSINIKSVEGYFYHPLAPGRWKILVNAKIRYKGRVFDAVDVKKGQTLDLGKISLESDDDSAKTSIPVNPN